MRWRNPGPSPMPAPPGATPLANAKPSSAPRYPTATSPANCSTCGVVRISSGPAPILVFLPGGAWIFGSRVLQGHALMAHLAELGWVCLSVQYRTSPKHRRPRQIIDVKAAIAWARSNADRYGGDRTFVAVAGCSAGGHMATLVGLTPGDPQWQAGLPASADTSVDAVVSVYGRYDWEDRSTPERARFMDFLERVVVKRPQSANPICSVTPRRWPG